MSDLAKKKTPLTRTRPELCFDSSRMGPFQEYKVKKSFGKDSTRSRIPRLMHQAFRLKDSQISDFPLSEDESKDCDISKKQNRTISPTSFSSDDTGCPSSQCLSPMKIRSVSDNSSVSSPIPVKSKAKVKRVRVSVVAECNGIIQKHKREHQQPSILHRGE
ncbi:hypothetical protein AMELA_G00077420 [Ameiurus melas]|uniref:Uncharacterized protein n=1 Tax=Ameiurus melas TaxID=219545 RepID=A0A7J6B0L9_AMEME|nr:hypothetical protein AMELA_G00077420 [Ameiurus melas]